MYFQFLTLFYLYTHRVTLNYRIIVLTLKLFIVVKLMHNFIS